MLIVIVVDAVVENIIDDHYVPSHPFFPTSFLLYTRIFRAFIQTINTLIIGVCMTQQQQFPVYYIYSVMTGCFFHSASAFGTKTTLKKKTKK
jgi:hypothetical protein